MKTEPMQDIFKCWETLEPAIMKFCKSKFPHEWADVMSEGMINFISSLKCMNEHGEPYPADLLKFAEFQCRIAGYRMKNPLKVENTDLLGGYYLLKAFMAFQKHPTQA